LLAASEPRHSGRYPVSVPHTTGLHWRGIRARLHGFDAVRAARIPSDYNPAHPLANAPEQYRHVNEEPDRCLLPETGQTEEQIPPPSRANRGASD